MVRRFAALALVFLWAMPVHGLLLVKDSTAQAVVYASPDAGHAASDLVAYIQRISGAQLEMASEQPSGQGERTLILLGGPAVKAGLQVPGPTPSQEGYAIKTDSNRLLIAGESPEATRFAVFHFLETLGCRWFMDCEFGEVVPALKTIEVPALDIRETPDFPSRRMWGSGWLEESDWKVANRCGGIQHDTRHAWSGLLPEREYFDAHPEYYSLIEGRRRPRQLCTSNPDVVKAVTAGIIETFRRQPSLRTISISPNDGGGFCQCENCRKLDVPGYLEPSSGAVCLSDRLQVFYNAVAREVGREFPDRILNYYAYADYTLPPKRERKLEPNLMVWVAPIRHCRLHGIGSPDCASRLRLGKLIEDWSHIAGSIGYRTYNFNLAESITPYSKVSIWKQEIPFLKAHGCSGLNFETLDSWAINGPHIYLSARLAWDADADVDAIMDDYYEKFCGKAAAPIKAYWERIDRAFRNGKVHLGGFDSLPQIYTAELLAACDADLDEAEKAAADDPFLQARVGIFRRGFENARMFVDMNNAFCAGRFEQARDTYGKLLEHVDAMVSDGILNHHGAGYLRRFIGPKILAACRRSTDGCEIVQRLTDRWSFRRDPKDEGESGRWFSDTGDSGWEEASILAGAPGWNGDDEPSRITWYRTSFEVTNIPSGRKLFLWFASVDGTAKVWLDGKPVGEALKQCTPFDVEISEAVSPGTASSLYVRVDHSHPTELSPGGIAGPVFVYTSADGKSPDPATAGSDPW